MAFNVYINSSFVFVPHSCFLFLLYRFTRGVDFVCLNVIAALIENAIDSSVFAFFLYEFALGVDFVCQKVSAAIIDN